MPTSLAPPAVRLQLLIGPGIPVPAPREAVEALTRVTVHSASGQTQSGFELRFELPRRSPLHTLFLVSGGASIPFVRVVVVVTIAGTTEVMIDGVMTHHAVSGGGDDAVLTIRGKDLTAMMDVVPFDGLPYPAMSPALRVLAVIGKYAAVGCVPLVIPSILEDVPLPIDRIPRHQGTDYRYVRSLAEEVGHVFYIDPGPTPGVSKAYWGPEIRLGEPQPALNAGISHAHDNVTSIDFTFDKERKELPVVYIQEPNTKVPIPVPIPDVTPLNPPLGAVPPLPPKITFLNDTAKMTPLAAAMKGIAYAATHSDSVFATGSLDVVRYGRVLRSRRLVGVRGAGEAFDGLYFVTSVNHTLEAGAFTTSFGLARNALMSTLPAVPA